MASIDISPNGELDIGFARIGGTDFVQMRLHDGTGTDMATLTYTRAHFITLTDHLKMIADEIMAGRVEFPGA